MRFHSHYERLLARSDELSATERERLLAHLGTCQQCRQEQRTLRAHDESLRRFAGAQPPMSQQAVVLARLKEEPAPLPETPSHAHGRVLPATAGLLLAACLLLVAGLAVGQRLLPHPAGPTAVAVRGNCTVAGASWALKGPCRIVSSPTALRSPGVTVYPLALRWAKQHVRNPHYIIRRNDRLPAVIHHSGKMIYVSEVARDAQSHQSMYVVGEEQ